MLELKKVASGYGETRILHGVDLAARSGSIHALLGRNGAGKTTTLKTIMGLLPVNSGSISFAGKTISRLPTYKISRLGVAYVPETRDIFGALSVRENLQLAGRLATTGSHWTLERVLEFFPNLKQRLNNGGHELSGGEQQMLAIGRALMSEPKLLVLDEPTEGLAPVIVQQIFSQLKQLKEESLTLLLVEQNLHFALGIADDISLMNRGQIVWRGDAKALQNDEQARKQWLAV